MRLGKKGNKEQIEPYKMGTQELDFQTWKKIFAVLIDSNLSFEIHINTVVNKANRTMVRKTYDYIDATILTLIFKCLVRPILEYTARLVSEHY